MTKKKEKISEHYFEKEESNDKKVSDDIEKESSIFSDYDLTNVDESYDFWKRDMEEGLIFQLLDEFISSDEDAENIAIKENFKTPKQISDAEINTCVFEENALMEEVTTINYGE